MSHALIRTNPTGQPFRGRCIKCGAENLPSSAVAQDCPDDEYLSDENALLAILNANMKGGEE